MATLRFLANQIAQAAHTLHQSLSWEGLKAIVNAILDNAVRLIWVFASVFIIIFIVQNLFRDLVIIEPISVPKAFSERGYTPEVASDRLSDALFKFATGSGSSMNYSNTALGREINEFGGRKPPDIVVPRLELSLDAIVSLVRSVLHYGSRRSISGEFIFRGNLAWLRLRVNSIEVYSSPNGFDAENPDDLLAAAASAVMETIAPYFVASDLYDKNPMQALEKAENIIARFPEADVNVHWSYILKGVFFNDHKDYVHADTALRKAIDLDEKNSAAHNNLGNALAGQGKLDDAIAEYRRAIDIDPKYVVAHTNLGRALADQGKLDDAIAEYRRAIEINPKYAVAHANLGNALILLGKLDDAIAEYRRVIEIDPKYAGKLGLLDALVDEKNFIINKEREPAAANAPINLGSGW
jgi:tetratricopeptide (TPR) repeat protein